MNITVSRQMYISTEAQPGVKIDYNFKATSYKFTQQVDDLFIDMMNISKPFVSGAGQTYKSTTYNLGAN